MCRRVGGSACRRKAQSASVLTNAIEQAGGLRICADTPTRRYTLPDPRPDLATIIHQTHLAAGKEVSNSGYGFFLRICGRTDRENQIA